MFNYKVLPVTIAVLFGFSLIPANAQMTPEPQAQYAPGRLIVKFKDSARVSAGVVQARSAAVGAMNLQDKYKPSHFREIFKSGADTPKAMSRVAASVMSAASQASKEITYVMDIDPKANVLQAAADYAKDPNVVYAQPDYKRYLNMVPNDPYYTQELWNIRQIEANRAWDLTQGENVVVAVVDSGVDYNHSDLAANIWANPNEIPNNGADDDGNGFIDDVRGWNFAGNDNNPMDSLGHGTHVSGTIAAVGNNNTGIIGVAPRVRIMPIRSLGNDGGYVSDLAAGIVYAARNGAKIINNSWGCIEWCPSDPLLEEAVRYAYHEKGAVVVFSAGNGITNKKGVTTRQDIIHYSPQNMPEVITVAASDKNGNVAAWSNFGKNLTITAPGVNVLSTVPNEDYAYYSGTSMAAPHICAVAALMLSHHPLLTNENVKEILKYTAVDVGVKGVDTRTGYGRVNAYKAVITAAVPQASINVPLNNAIINAKSKTITIVGVATGPSLQRYELSYNRVGTDGWVMIGSPVVKKAVDNARLGVWDIRDLQPGQYNLRLDVFRVSGASEQSNVVVEIKNAPPTMLGFVDRIIREGVKFSVQVKATDPEGEALVFSAQMANGEPLSTIGATMTTKGLFNLPTPVFAHGDYVINVTATDRVGQAVSKLMLIKVVASATLNGRVLNTSGKAIAGAEVTIGAQSYVSDAAGRFTVSDLATGSYSGSISKSGYVTQAITFKVTGSDVSINKTINLKKS